MVNTDIKSIAINNFKSRRLLELIKIELDKDHVGNTKEKVLVFTIAVSGFLQTRYRCSCALNGDSSEGKTNIMKAVSLHLPEPMFRWYDGVTKSGVQGDLKNSINVGTIFFKELNKQDENYALSEFLKSVCEEGHRETKRDIETGNKDLITYDIPKLSGIYATTKMVDDDELNNRFIVVSIVGNPSLYENVNNNTMRGFSDVKIQIEQDERRKEGTWLKHGLSEILRPVDYFEIPHIDCVKPNNQIARSKRDLKRFINIACVIAWLYQLQRELKIINGKNVLVVLPEDLINAYNIMSNSLTQSFNSLTSRDFDTLKAIEKRAKPRSEKYEDSDIRYVERRELQSELNIKTKSGMWKRLKSLKDSDAITIIGDKDNENFWIRANIDIISCLKGDFIKTETITCLREFLTKPDSICFENKDEPDKMQDSELPKKTTAQTKIREAIPYKSKNAESSLQPDFIKMSPSERIVYVNKNKKNKGVD